MLYFTETLFCDFILFSFSSYLFGQDKFNSKRSENALFHRNAFL